MQCKEKSYHVCVVITSEIKNIITHFEGQTYICNNNKGALTNNLTIALTNNHIYASIFFELYFLFITENLRKYLTEYTQSTVF